LLLDSVRTLDRRQLWTLLPLGLFILVFMQQASDPYTIDEAAFPYGASGVLTHGVPQFYNGETRPMDMGLWHPPLYIYTLALNILVFGDSAFAVRLYGLFAILGAWVIGVAILRRWFPGNTWLPVLTFSVAFLLNPLVVAGALTPDIDGTIGVTITVAFLWLASRMIKQWDGPHFLAVSAGLWFLAFSTKLTLAGLMIPVVVIAVILARNDRMQLAIRSVIGLVIGFFGFVATWAILALAVGADFMAPITYFKSGLTKSGASQGLLELMEGRLTSGIILFWIGPTLIIAGLVSLTLVLARPRVEGERRLALLLTAASALMFGAYLAITGPVFTYPKYWGVVIPGLALLCAMASTRLTDVQLPSLRQQNGLAIRWTGIGVAIALTTAAAVYAYIEISTRLGVNTGIINGLPTIGRVVVIFGVVLALTIAASVLVYLSVSVNTSGPRQAGAATWFRVGLAGVLASALLVPVVATLVFRSSPDSTRYYFGERGLDKVITYVRNDVLPDLAILAPKDVGIQSEHEYFEDAIIYASMGNQEFRDFLATEPLGLVVTRKNLDYSKAVFPKEFAAIADYFEPIPNQPSPDFVLWARKK